MGLKYGFEQAMEAYRSKRYKEAISKFSGLLERYDQHTPSQIQLALSLYHLGRYRAADAGFSRIRQDDVQRYFYFEYAFTKYSVKKWLSCSKYFSKIKPKHPYYDLAMYFAGVCFFNLENFQKASKYLRRASVLPSRFVQSRKKLVKLSAIRQRKNTKGSVNSKVVFTAKSSKKSRIKQHADLLSEKQFNLAVMSSILKTNSTGIELQTVNSRAIPDSNNQITDLFHYLKLKIDLGLLEKVSKKYSTGLQTGIAMVDGGTENPYRIKIWDDLYTKQSYFAQSNHPSPVIQFNPWFESLFFHNFIGVNILFEKLFDDEKNLSILLARFYLEKRASKFTYYLIFEESNLEGNHISRGPSFNMQYNFVTDTTLGFHVVHSLKFYQEDFLEGPAGLTAFKVYVNQLIPFRGSVELDVFGSKLENYLRPFSEEVLTAAEGTQLGVSGKLTIKMSNWAEFELRQSFVSYDWNNFEPDYTQELWESQMHGFEEILTFRTKMKIDF